MSRGDGTGPVGQGPMTGRGLGYCAGNDVPGFAVSGGLGRGRGGVFGRGLGMRRGFGRGLRLCWNVGNMPAESPVDEAAGLKAQLGALENAVSALKQRLSEFENQGESQ